MFRIVTRISRCSTRRRYYSIPTITSPRATRPIDPTFPLKKQKIDLRPAPVKPIPRPPPASFPPSNPHHHVLEASAPPKLAEAKEEAKHAIRDAETHGVITPAPPHANWFKRTLHTAIQLLKFYFRGVKLIFSRRKEISLINARIAAGGSPLTRAEFRLIQTQKDDIKKVIPFLVIALFLEELIPLIAIYVPSMLPSTCILPSQLQRIEEKRTQKALASAIENRYLYAQLRKLENPPGYLPLQDVRLIGASQALCSLLGLSTIGIDFLRIRRIKRHLDFLTRDDMLLSQNDASKYLSVHDLKEAVEERGMSAQGLSHKDLQAQLQWWLESVKPDGEGVCDLATARRLALIISR